MKVSEKQLMMLTDVAKESLRIAGLFGGYDLPIRIQLVNDLINQQSNELKDVDSGGPEKPQFPPNIILKDGDFKHPYKK